MLALDVGEGREVALGANLGHDAGVTDGEVEVGLKVHIEGGVGVPGDERNLVTNKKWKNWPNLYLRVIAPTST